MKKLLSCVILLGFGISMIAPVLAEKELPNTLDTSGSSSTASGGTNLVILPASPDPVKIPYPAGDDFVRLKALIASSFDPVSENSPGYNCIWNDAFCTNYRYTKITEKSLQLILLKTYQGNEAFYRKLFMSSRYSSSFPSNGSVQNILAGVPKTASLPDWRTLVFGESIGGEILEASFGVNYTENTNPSSMIGVIEQKILDLKEVSCSKNGGNYDNCTGKMVSNIYLPTPEELYRETVYMNGAAVQIGTLKNEIEYTVTGLEQARLVVEKFVMTSAGQRGKLPCMNSVVPSVQASCMQALEALEKIEAKSLLPYLIKYKKYPNSLSVFTNEIPNSLIKIISDNFSYKRVTGQSGEDYEIRYIGKIGETPTIKNPKKENATSIAGTSDIVEPTYTLRYKKNRYTFQEAQMELQKINTTTGALLASKDNVSMDLPCRNSSLAIARSECSAALRAFREIQTALTAHEIDTASLPETLSSLTGVYLSRFPQEFTPNFSYKKTTQEGIDDYEIRYIGTIGEGSLSTASKKDYSALMSGALIEDIPSIFSYIPADSMVLYVKNPANLIDVLNQQSTASQEFVGTDVSEGISVFVKSFFQIDSLNQIQAHLKHEMAIVVNNLDLTAPDIVMIISESDKEAILSMEKSRVIGARDGFIFLAYSRESLDTVMTLVPEKSMKNAPDFRYVWWKKSVLIKDAMLYVGDAFFEKILSLETYITHYRKYRDYSRIRDLQELLWAYEDTLGRNATSLTQIGSLGLSALTGEILSEYSIIDGLVTHQNIGTLQSLKTLPEAKYDLTTVTRQELEDYKYSVLLYRDIWRASLDPMGIVLNRYGDGIEIDFFMTPVPSFATGEMRYLQNIFQGIAKDSLSFVDNEGIRVGLLSLAFGFDPKKIQKKFQSNKELGKEFLSFTKSLLNGKDIFDYLAGEFAFSLGSLDPDMFEGWNIEKIDAYFSVQVTSEEKGKEFIELLRKQFFASLNPDESEEEALLIQILAKPMIEDYAGKKIYYMEDIPFPFVGKIGIAYTFVDNFLIFGLNRTTLRRVIDVSESGDAQKRNIINTTSFTADTFFATLFDGQSMTNQLKILYQKNTATLPRMIRSELRNMTDLSGLISTYYSSHEYAKRLEQKEKPFVYTFGFISLSGKQGEIMARIDSSTIGSLSGAHLQNWENLKNDMSFPKDILSPEGISLDTLLGLKSLPDILALSLMTSLDTHILGSEGLFPNITLGFSLGDDELGFRLRAFTEESQGRIFPAIPILKDKWVMAGIVLFFLFFVSLVVQLIRIQMRPQPTSDGVAPQIIDHTITPISSPRIEVEPVANSDLLTQLMSRSLTGDAPESVATKKKKSGKKHIPHSFI